MSGEAIPVGDWLRYTMKCIKFVYNIYSELELWR